MIESPRYKEVKKTLEIDSSSDFDDDDEDVESIEYNIDEAVNRIKVTSHRKNDADPAWSKKGHDQNSDLSVTKVLSKHLRHPPSKDQSFAFPSATTSDIGLKHEDARVVLTDTTGTVAFTQSPDKKFILQTPLDDGPFCAISIKHATGFNYSALYLYSEPIFAPSRVLDNQMWVLPWRWNGLPILILPIAFLAMHDTYVSHRLAQLHSELAHIESELLGPYGPGGETLDFNHLTRRLHEFSTALANLARRAHFQDTVLTTVTEALVTMNGPAGFSLEIQRARLDGLKKAMLARRYDLEMMPKREMTARATIFNLTVLRDQAISLAIGQANLEIARSARQIAEATMRDSAAMRTIAVLTMLFLPGTAVASFFSMTMFNWTPNSSGSGSSSGGGAAVSSYIWIYFVLAVPLTALVLGVWWYWQRARARAMRSRSDGGDFELELLEEQQQQQRNLHEGREKVL